MCAPASWSPAADLEGQYERWRRRRRTAWRRRGGGGWAAVAAAAARRRRTGPAGPPCPASRTGWTCGSCSSSTWCSSSSSICCPDGPGGQPESTAENGSPPLAALPFRTELINTGSLMYKQTQRWWCLLQLYLNCWFMCSIQFHAFHEWTWRRDVASSLGFKLTSGSWALQ